MPVPSAKIEEITDDPEQQKLSEEESDAEDNTTAQAQDQPQTTSSSKKKKKKKSKAAKALKALVQPKSGEPPEQVVETLLAKTKEQHPELEGVNADSVLQAVKILKVMDVLEGKTGLGGKNRKSLGDHKFWKTQPVPQLGETAPEKDGPIEPAKPRDEIKQDPYPLPKDFVWSTVDVNDPAQLKELYELLSQNYVEDLEASFRFRYSAEFLEWALKPPGFYPEWLIGVRVQSNQKLVGFIAGVPVKLRVRESTFDASEINFLCVHKKLRSKRLAPVLIKEVTRRVHLEGIFQAIYTAGVVLPTPVSTCRYYHRSINVPKLVDISFTHVPRNETVRRMITKNKLSSQPTLQPHGLREMEEGDVDVVMDLWMRYMNRFQMSPVLNREEVKHNLLGGRGKGEMADGRREAQVVWTYVVENPETKKITDFFSFYSLPSSVMQSTKHPVLEAAYLFYYGTETAFTENAEQSGRLQRRLLDLIGDALVIAEQAHFDVFNALTLMDNSSVLTELKFGQGDGFLNYYLYNWRTAPMEGVNAIAGGQGVGRGVGVVML